MEQKNEAIVDTTTDQYESLVGGDNPANGEEVVDNEIVSTDRVISVIEAVGRGISLTIPDYGDEPIKRLTKMAHRMRQLADFDDAIKLVTKAINEEYDRLKLKDLPDLMAELDMRTFTVEGAGRVQLAGDVYANIPAEKRDEAYKWLKENNYGSLVQETVNSSTLKAWCKEGMQQGRELPEGMFSVTPFTRASLVKVKGKK